MLSAGSTQRRDTLEHVSEKFWNNDESAFAESTLCASVTPKHRAMINSGA
jgi:hypothetical protein